MPCIGKVSIYFPRNDTFPQTKRTHIGNDTCVSQRQSFGETAFVCIRL